MTLFNTPYNSFVLIILAIALGLVSSITTFDIRLSQARANVTITKEHQSLPGWVAILYWVEWIITICMILLNWKFGLIAWGIKFILKVLPVLEVIGNLLMSPFRKQ